VPDLPVDPSFDDAAGWMSKAVEDLAVAEVVLQSGIGATWASCFHAQQAVEKALKAILTACGIDFPRTHALQRLRELLPAELQGSFDEHALIELSPWAVAGRYPEDIENPSNSEVASALDIARGALEASRVILDRRRAE
jgi:HEPN domain-containing protein